MKLNLTPEIGQKCFLSYRLAVGQESVLVTLVESYRQSLCLVFLVGEALARCIVRASSLMQHTNKAQPDVYQPLVEGDGSVTVIVDRLELVRDASLSREERMSGIFFFF